MEVVGEDIDTVTYDEETGEILEPCALCAIDTSRSDWNICIQCQHPRIELFRVREEQRE